MFEHIWKKLFVTLIGKREYRRRFENIQKNPVILVFTGKNIVYGLKIKDVQSSLFFTAENRKW